MDQAAVDHRRTLKRWNSLAGRQSIERKNSGRTYDAENTAAYRTIKQARDIRTVLEQQRQESETDDDEIERRTS